MHFIFAESASKFGRCFTIPEEVKPVGDGADMLKFVVHELANAKYCNYLPLFPFRRWQRHFIVLLYRLEHPYLKIYLLANYYTCCLRNKVHKLRFGR